MYSCASSTVLTNFISSYRSVLLQQCDV
jgi:hypothetical protein